MDSLGPWNLPQALQQQVELSSTRIAIRSGGATLTFNELHTRALHLAHQIQRRRLSRGSPIGIVAPRGIDHVLAQVAVIYAGCSCVPLDVKQPDTYLDGLLSRLECALVLTDPAHQDRLLGYDHLLSDNTIKLDRMKGEELVTVVTSSNEPSSCSHIFHTSGTTGKPKAVQVRAEGILNLAYNGTYLVERGQRFAHVGNVSFDAALFEMWVSLLSGSTLVVIEQDVLLDPVALSQRLRDEAIDVMLLTPALLTATANACPNAFSTLRTLYTGGEAINVQTVRTIFENGPPQKLVNLYGPTECTVYAICHQVTLEDAQANHVPLGRPIDKMEAFVVDEALNPVPVGEVGELLLRGAGVAQGYFGEEDKTAKAFVLAPHLVPQDHTVLRTGPDHFYRTGDLVRINRAGSYDFIGRRDNQVKISGQRIELEAVELMLLETGLVSAAVVLKVQPEDSIIGSILLAYVIPSSSELGSNAITRAFVQRAPQMMVPRVEFIDELPLRHTGKVDRKRLEQQYLAKINKARTVMSLPKITRQGASVNIQECLRFMWLEILGLPVDRLEPSDNFFHIGGTSLQAATLVARVRQTFAVDLASAALYEHATLEALGRLIKSLQAGNVSQDKKKDEDLWLQDAELGKSLQPIGGMLPDWKSPGEGRVFFTGATGFVGAFLLHELLQMPQVRKVACLIRANDAVTGMARLQKNLDKYRIRIDAATLNRVLIVPGDFGQPHLGLSPDLYELYAGWASVVFHLGAHVNYVQPYSTHRTANVLGTLHMLEFANCQRPKMLHYSSTPAAYGPSGFVLGATKIKEDERPIKYMKALHYDTGYSQSKMTAESVVWNAIDNGLPAAIFRPGFVLGHTKSGISNPDDFVGRLVSSCVQMGCYPLLPAQRKEFVPVDFVVGALLHITSSPANLGRAYNLIQPEPNRAMDMITTFQMISSLSPSPLRGVPYSEWVRCFALETRDPLHPLMPMLEEKVLGDLTRWEVQEQMVVFGSDNLAHALWGCTRLLKLEPMSVLFMQYMRHWLPSN